MRILAILAVSCALGQHVAQLVHALTVEHVRCAEHGELLDVASHGTQASSPAGIAAGERGQAPRHDHCAVDWLAHAHATTGEASFVEPPLPIAPPPLAAAPIAVSQAPLAFAPKTSPPTS